jgi:alpha-aminoadipate carrier protein LysW
LNSYQQRSSSRINVLNAREAIIKHVRNANSAGKIPIPRRSRTVPLAVCPECEAEIHVDEDVDKGEIINCEECETALEVVGLDPIELDLASEDKDEDVEEDDDY